MDDNTAAIMRLTTWPKSNDWDSAKDFVHGPGSRTFLRSLSGYHYRKSRDRMRGYDTRSGYTIYKPIFCVSREAREVWENPEQRKLWLTYHKATSRLVTTS